MIGVIAIAGAAFLFLRSRKGAAGAAPSGLTTLNRAIDNIVGGISSDVSSVVGSAASVPVTIVHDAASTANAIVGAGFGTVKYLGVTAVKAPATVVKGAVSLGTSAVHGIASGVGSAVSTIGSWF